MKTAASRRRLQICSRNQVSRLPALLEELRDRGYVVEIEECLDHCTRCESCAFALVCGRFLFAETLEEFLRKLR